MLTAEPKSQGSSWYNATRVESPARSRLSVELDVDVCVIGAGLAGLTAAREVAKRGWSVVVLETKSVAWDASGRNTGIVRPGFGLGAAALVERVGLDHAKQLWALSVDGAEYVRKAAREMQGAAPSETGWLHVSKTDNTKAMAAEAALLVGEFGTPVEPWPAERVREVLRTVHYFHGLHHPQGFSLHTLNYALGLAAAAEAAGARIFEDTPALEIDPAGVRKRIVTGGSRVRAAHVVLAGNIHLADLLPQFSSTLVPAFNTVIATAPLGAALHEAVRYQGAVTDGEPADNQYRVVDGDRLMWSVRGTVWRGRPQRTAKALLREIRQLYPALRDAKAEYAWCGAIGSTVHRMPQIGEISPGLWLLSGFGNHGLNTTAMGGELVARAIVEGDRTWQLFSPFALVWAGGGLGRAAKQMFSWSARASALTEGIMARRREVKRLKAEATAAKVRQFAGIAAAAAAPPVPSEAHGPVHPPIEAVATPVEAVPEPEPVPAARIEQPEELFPAAEPVFERPEELFPERSPVVHQPVAAPGPVAPVPVPEIAPPVLPPEPQKRKRGPKKRKSAEGRTTLAELSREMIDDATQAADQGPVGDAAPPGTRPSVDKKV